MSILSFPRSILSFLRRSPDSSQAASDVTDDVFSKPSTGKDAPTSPFLDARNAFAAMSGANVASAHVSHAIALISLLFAIGATAFAFYQLGERSNLQRLVEALLVPDVARQARAYLTELGAASAPELHPWLQQNDPVLRKAVVEVLGLSGHAASEAALQQVARGDTDRAVGEAARQALLRLRALPQGARTR